MFVPLTVPVILIRDVICLYHSKIGTYRDLSRWKHPGIDQPDYNLIEVWLIEAIAIIPWKHRGIYQIIII